MTRALGSRRAGVATRCAALRWRRGTPIAAPDPMGQIIVEQIVSADGFAADRDRGIGFFEQDPDLDELAEPQLALLAHVDAFILGANTYRMFAAYWPTAQSEGDPLRGWLTSHPLHVVSNSLAAAPWGPYAPGHLERGEAAEAVAAARDRYRGDVIIWGSLTLTEALFRAKLVDRLRLRTVPRLIGAGVSVAPRDLELTPLTLVEAKVFPRGHLLLDYRVER